MSETAASVGASAGGHSGDPPRARRLASLEPLPADWTPRSVDDVVAPFTERHSILDSVMVAEPDDVDDTELDNDHHHIDDAFPPGFFERIDRGHVLDELRDAGLIRPVDARRSLRRGRLGRLFWAGLSRFVGNIGGQLVRQRGRQ